MDKKGGEEDYDNNTGIDCPHCGTDRPDHTCGNCRSEMSKEDCWKFGGYCSEKCLKYITEEIPKIRKQKEELGIKCKCEEPQCGKCLSINCQDDNCPTHTLESKKSWNLRNKR